MGLWKSHSCQAPNVKGRFFFLFWLFSACKSWREGQEVVAGRQGCAGLGLDVKGERLSECRARRDAEVAWLEGRSGGRGGPKTGQRRILTESFLEGGSEHWKECENQLSEYFLSSRRGLVGWLDGWRRRDLQKTGRGRA
ncbi:hypothetical protein HDK64DRAFT_115502 [Phyllosticta capitalensis]